MFTAPTTSATALATSASSSTTSTTTTTATSRSTGLQRGITFLRNLHLHPPDDAREHARPSKTRPRAASSTEAAAAAAAAAATAASTTSQPALPALRPDHRPDHRPEPRASLLSRRLTSNAPLFTLSSPAPPLPSTTTTTTTTTNTNNNNNMTRTRAETAAPQLTVRNTPGPTPTTPSGTADDAAANGGDGAAAMKNLSSIRFIPHQDPRAGRPSLQFPTITRTLPDESAIIRVGRYSERDNAPEIPSNVPSAAAVGFKSKVVSRKHCELWCKDGSWYIKDVKSSSGTFLNHIRLSQPNVESKPFRLKDGDIIQLGIDFRGGEEMIFRCVKIRVECNRGWQQGLNTFNKQTHQRLRNLSKPKKEGDTASMHTSECVICLMTIAPCQSLFVAPCSHVWHYKCIRPILNGATWPNFHCPNCRAVADLEEDVEDPGEFEDWDDEGEQSNGDANVPPEDKQGDRHITPRASMTPLNGTSGEGSGGGVDLSDLQQAISNISITESLHGVANQTTPQTPERHLSPTASSITQPVTISVSGTNDFSGLSPLHAASQSGLAPDRAPDGPMTPRNDIGPFVLDGSAGRTTAGNHGRDASMAEDEARGGAPVSPTPAGAPSLPPVRFE